MNESRQLNSSLMFPRICGAFATVPHCKYKHLEQLAFRRRDHTHSADRTAVYASNQFLSAVDEHGWLPVIAEHLVQ